MKQRNFAVIGRNFVVDSFLTAALARDDVRLLGVYSRRADTGRAFADKYGAERVYTDLDALAGDEDIDFVYVASPNICHEAQTVRLLEGGKHVLVEKPAAPTLAGFLQMADAAKQNGRVLMEAMMPAHMPALEAVRALLPRIAPVRMADFSYCQYSSRYDKFKAGIVENAFDPTLCNGALLDIGVYCVLWIAALFGTPRDLQCAGTFLPGSIDADGAFLAQYDDLVCRVAYSKIADSAQPCEIQGEGGRIRIDRASRPREVTLTTRGGASETFRIPDACHEMSYELADFLACLDGASPEPFTEITRISLGITDRVREKLGINFQKEKRNYHE